MCGILGYKKQGNNERIKLRGQDHTSTFKYKDFTFIHNLLYVTGEFTPQPFVDGNIVCVYNGEIYNHKFKRSDGEVLIPLYKKYGTNFPRYLDGEFAIALFNFDDEICVFATDPFKTKPLFINDTDFASYRSGVGGYRANPNEIVVKKLDGTIIERKPVVKWDLTQYKDSYDDWIKAFERAIKKRAVNNCFLGLSSGYDSGSIACEMLKQGIDFKAYTYTGEENLDILNKRARGLNIEFFKPKREVLEFLQNNIDDEKYTIKYKSGMQLSVLSDEACAGVGTFCKIAKEEGRKVCLSGQGADEILSDYSLFPDQSELLGVFPQKLELWNNFNYGCQESYLMKEEYAGGAFNIETRYPFLDKDLVQEFLWLKPELKNRHYKAPLMEYLKRNNYPFEGGIKKGFSVIINKK